MFCRNCGANLADGTKFCPSCGTNTGSEAAAPQAAPVYAPKQPNPMVEKFVAVLKNFWAKPVATVADSAKSNTLEWVLLAAINVLVYALATAVVGLETLIQLVTEMAGGLVDASMIGEFVSPMYPFFGIFGIGLLLGVVVYGLVAAGIWVLVAQIFKKNVSINSALNMVAVATLPMTAVGLVNMLAGLIYAPLAFMLFFAAVLMTAVCLYSGMQKLDKLEKSPFYGYSAVMLIVVVVCWLFASWYLEVIGGALTSGIMGGAMSGIGSMGMNMLG